MVKQPTEHCNNCQPENSIRRMVTKSMPPAAKTNYVQLQTHGLHLQCCNQHSAQESGVMNDDNAQVTGTATNLHWYPMQPQPLRGGEIRLYMLAAGFQMSSQ
jgi:hypothetical protein